MSKFEHIYQLLAVFNSRQLSFTHEICMIQIELIYANRIMSPMKLKQIDIGVLMNFDHLKIDGEKTKRIF